MPKQWIMCLCGAGFAAADLSFALPASAACPGWTLPARYEVHQANGFTVGLLVKKDQSAGIAGRAEYLGRNNKIERGEIIAGTVTANSLTFTIRWANGSTGVYRGTIGPAGNVSGATHDPANSGAQSTFTADRLICRKTPPASGEQPKPDATMNQRIEARCRAYANDALRAVAENGRLRCASAGKRWSGSFEHHYGWCMGLADGDRHFMQAETAAREQALKVCAAASGSGIERQPNINRRPGGVVR